MNAFGTILGLLMYMAPTIVAVARKAANKWRVLVINVLLGWTLIGWIVALVMALPGHGQQPVQNVVQVQNTFTAGQNWPDDGRN